MANLGPVTVSIYTKLPFWKMHGLGNDYIVSDNRDGKLEEPNLANIARKICKRRFSIGADGLLLLYNSSIADVKMRIFNADGSEAEMCGNGIRCFAKYCYETNKVNGNLLTIETLAGTKRVKLNTQKGMVNSVTVEMGKPILERSQIPVLGDGVCIDESITLNGKTFKFTCVSVGNPHCVIFVDDVVNFPVKTIGSQIEYLKIFPKRINVEFVQVLNRDEIKIRIWERGVGETLACGTGACAAVVAANLLGKADNICTVRLLGGNLNIEYNSKHILMTGPAEKSFNGFVEVKSDYEGLL